MSVIIIVIKNLIFEIRNYVCDGTSQTSGVNGLHGVHSQHMQSPADIPEQQSSENDATLSIPSEKAPASRSIVGYTVFALGIALFIRFFIATPYVVDGSSMEPTFEPWQYLIIDKLIYDIKPLERGDVIVFTQPQDTSRSLIKRVIGLPGETLRISGSQVTIFNESHPEGLILTEPYVSSKNASTGDFFETTLDATEYFVLGDNRRVSSDSRIWGALPYENVTGRVDARLFPIEAISILPGKAQYQES